MLIFNCPYPGHNDMKDGEKFVNMKFTQAGAHSLCSANLANPERPATWNGLREGQELERGQQICSDLKIENQETKDSMQLLQRQIKCKEWHIVT